MKILVLAAHSDDEVLGCGATIARLAKEGHSVIPVIICENASVRYRQEMQTNLEEWSRRSSAILGILEPIFEQMPDQKLDTYSALDMAQRLEKIIHDVRPEIIFTHHGGDINKDHRVVFEATMVAARPLPGSKVRSIYSYETISSTEWAATDYYAKFNPNIYYDVNDTLALKLEAFSQYKTEIREYPHPRSLEAIEIRAKDWGARVGLMAAEAFQLIRTIV
jgi:LmbE family N-acetylglucosaminyl deacetylase